ncbi:MAG: DUF3566 domain-containing protein [Actinomycetota bacterium]
MARSVETESTDDPKDEADPNTTPSDEDVTSTDAPPDEPTVEAGEKQSESTREHDPLAGDESASANAAPTTTRVTDPAPTIPTAVIGAEPAVASAAVHAPQPSRKARVVVKKVGPLSVLRFSLLFYLCVMLVLLLAGSMLYLALDALGTIDAAIRLAINLSVVETGFEANGSWLFWRCLVIGLVGVVLWSAINVFITFLYNLISDVVGGIEITLGEKRSRRG